MISHRFPYLIGNPALYAGAGAPPTLLDNFDGASALTAHTPDICPAGSSWSIASGGFGDLAGGFLPFLAGSGGTGVINVGLDSYILRCRFKYVPGHLYLGLVIRSNASASDKYTFGVSFIDGTSVGWNLPNSNILSAAQSDAQFRPYTLVNGNYYTFTLLLSGAITRAYDESGALLLASSLTLKTGQTYLGPYTAYPSGSWDFIEVRPVTRPCKIFSIMGDSISNDAIEWPGYVAANYNNGYCYFHNHAVSASSIMGQMDTQTNESELDTDSDFTIIALGTNDTDNAAITAEYQENLQELYGTLHKPIYAMNILPRTGGNRDVNNPRIAAAVAAAQAAGVNVTLWNTDGWIDPAADTSDGLHPNAAGQVKIGQQILSRL